MKECIDFILKKEKKPVDLEKIFKRIENFKKTENLDYEISEDEKNEVIKILEDGIKKYEYYMTPNGNFTLFTKTSFRIGRFHGNRIGEGTVFTKTSYVSKDGKRNVKNEKFYINREECNNAIDGDLVLIDIGGKSPSVSKILNRSITNVVGEVTKEGKKYFVKPIDKKKKQLTIELKEEIEEGSVVSVSLNEEKDNNYYIGKIMRKFEHANSSYADALLEAFKSGMPEGFSEESLKQLDSIPDVVLEKDKENRIDLTDMEIFSIDGEDTKDKDDCISLNILENGNYLLGVHIADVAYYVKEGTFLDKDAFRKGNSYYFGGLVEPQLPTKLSNGICSLNENVERLTKSIFIEFNKNGDVVSRKLVPSYIKSRASLTYEKVNKLFNEEDIDGYLPYKETLQNMKELSSILRKKRLCEDGAIIFNKPEIKFIHDSNGNPIDVTLRYEDDASILIEEFMLQANMGVAEILTEKGIPCVYRIHDEPNRERLEEFMKLLDVMNMPFQFDARDILDDKEKLQALAVHIKINGNKSVSPMLNTNLVKCMSHAAYNTNNIGHYGIGSKIYCHFTSPIRRIADLAISRIIDECYFETNSVKKKTNIEKWKEKADDYASQATKMERVAEEVEKNVLYMETAKYLNNFIGEEFEGTIITVSDKGISVQLDNLLEGKIRTRNLDGEYTCNPLTYTLVSMNNSGNYYIGDRLKMRLDSTSIDTKSVDFIVLEKIKENTIKDKHHSNQYVKMRWQEEKIKKAYI